MNLNHANILRFYGCFDDTDNIYLVLEHAGGGNLYRLLQNEKEKRFSELQAARYVMELAAALQYIHRKDVIHRDIKPENILVGNDGMTLLADFGWSIRTGDRRNTVCGTLDYMPPEMMKPGSDENSYSKKIDSWSLGVLIYEFLVGKPPFEDSDILTQRRIANCEMTVPEHVSPEAKDLIERVSLTAQLNTGLES
jgi:aurora kinase